uniref:Secreted protein n=1 Tax=Oryza brachyantha TaxID=4533 RepID=J3MR32_ORYBR
MMFVSSFLSSIVLSARTLRCRSWCSFAIPSEATSRCVVWRGHCSTSSSSCGVMLISWANPLSETIGEEHSRRRLFTQGDLPVYEFTRIIIFIFRNTVT